MSFWKSSITYDDFDCISDALGIERGAPYPHTDLNVEYTKQNSFNGGKHTQSYWDSLTPEEKHIRCNLRKNYKHSDVTKYKMSVSAHKNKPHLHKGGKLIKDGVVEEFKCMTHFCKKHTLSTGHVCELLQGKRKSVKGWRLWENH
ncbi:group I intron endonuclease [Synechococcus phage ACG-2014f]|uniref:Group I intron endonuclease n=1 Tax=Synechococcus phage ACG-2014f TaxID=1493511 RepID=A0A0E3HNR0_9CAUD|nr:group I intron endonuclease [Synechococcus phage ACG-2014f]